MTRTNAATMATIETYFVPADDGCCTGAVSTGATLAVSWPLNPGKGGVTPEGDEAPDGDVTGELD